MGLPTHTNLLLRGIMKTCVKCGAYFDARRCAACKKAWRQANPDKTKEYKRKYREASAEKIKEYQDKWRAENKEKKAASTAAWERANKEKVMATRAAWAASNKHLRRVYNRNRRDRKRHAGGTLSRGLVDRLLKLQRGRCACCSKPLGNNFHMDHIMPIALGGANEDWNIQLLKATCNMQKKDKHPADFMRKRGLLI